MQKKLITLDDNIYIGRYEELLTVKNEHEEKYLFSTK